MLGEAFATMYAVAAAEGDRAGEGGATKICRWDMLLGRSSSRKLP
jgi:hypothetical protein